MWRIWRPTGASASVSRWRHHTSACGWGLLLLVYGRCLSLLMACGRCLSLLLIACGRSWNLHGIVRGSCSFGRGVSPDGAPDSFKYYSNILLIHVICPYFLCFSFLVFLYAPTPSWTALTRHFMKSNSSPKAPHILTTSAPTQFFIFANPFSQGSFKAFIRATPSGAKASHITLQTPCGRSITTWNRARMATDLQETYS